MKSILKQGFEAPQPAKKEEFFRSAPLQTIGVRTFFWIQVGYIRKWIWVFSVFLFFTALISSCMFKKDILWEISAFMPILALSLITESGRSNRYSMAELEQASRFSQRIVLLARLAVLGVENLILTCMLVPLAFRNSGFLLAQVGVFLLCPYLLTVFLSVNVLRRVHGREADYICISIAFFVSIGNNLLRQSYSCFYESGALNWWLFVGIFLGGGTVYQYNRMLKQREELIWNS